MVEPDAFFSDTPPSSSGFGSALTSIGGAVTRAAGTAVGMLANPVMSRLQASGLMPGGSRAMSTGSGAVSVRFIDGLTGGQSRDWKVRISVNPVVFGFDGVLAPLAEQSGVIFPYTPQIQVTHQANYTTQRFTHSNYNHFAYENSEIQIINVSGEFTAQDQVEAQYVLACIYFFRSVTKMFFGDDQRAGNPPPLVFLDGYGDHYFKRVPCLVMSFSHTMPADVDYIETASNAGTRIPAVSTIQVGLQPVYSKQLLATFNLDEFAQGMLVRQGLV